uniref:SAP domain-containing protein n=2 Tax=Glossina TaxID=44049 RepID=A0A1A9UH06_GLOAU
MDLVNLEKLKVVDLRNELQTRGLDTKGVKAVLIERLRSHLESGGVLCSPAPGTPSRRSRRTRSMTRSPSPSPVKKALEPPILETLQEETNNSNNLEENKEEVIADAQLAAIEDTKNVDVVVAIENEIDNDQTLEKDINSVKEHELHSEIENVTDKCKDVSIEEKGPASFRNEQEEILIEYMEQIEEVVEDSESPKHQNVEEDILIETMQDVEEDLLKDSPKYQNEEDDILTEHLEENDNYEGARQNEKQQLIGDSDELYTGQENSQENEVEDKIMNVETKADTISVPITQDKAAADSNLAAEPVKPKSRSRSNSEHREHYRSLSRSLSPSSHRRSRSPKHCSGGSLNSPLKTVEDTNSPEDEPTIEDSQFGLSWFDSDLHLRIDPVTFTSARPINHDLYALVWSSVRANYGVREGKVCYEVRVAEEAYVGSSHEFRDEPYIRGFRVGFSLPSTTLLLGEAEHSFAYCESGRKATNNNFVEYSKAYQLDDVIGCYLDLESTPCTIKYTLNGEDLGVAFEFDKNILGENDALFPHVQTKGYEYQVNFADNDNLLVNAKRHIRKKRKTKKDCKKESDVAEKKSSNEEKSEKNAREDEDDMANRKTKEAEVIHEKELKGNMKEMKQKRTSTEDDCSKRIDAKPCKEDAIGPSPSKRQKLQSSTVNSEDEYEEVHPVPRKEMSLLPDYELIALIPEEKYISGPQRPESRKDCEVILMVGLPGSGKTTWVSKHLSENPDKRYHVIGADALIAKMTVDGVPRKTVHKGRFDRVHELCFNILTSLEDIAVKRRRNFILDQTNAYASAQRRKMKGFGDFKRIAVVCLPNEDELKRRLAEKKEKDGHVYAMKESTLNNIQANFTLPALEFGWFDDILYSDLNGEEAKEEVRKINEKGKKAIDSNPANRDKRQRRDNYRNDNRRRYDDRRRYEQPRNDTRWNDRRAQGNINYHYGNRGGDNGRWNTNGGNRNMSSSYRDERNRGYDNRQQPPSHRYGGGGGSQNWVTNNRQPRFDNRHGRYNNSGGGSGRYESYGSGGSNNRNYRGNDYRDNRDNRNWSGNTAGSGNNRRDTNYHSGAGSSQRDFRHGHRDVREDSRGGSTSTTSRSTKYNSHSTRETSESGVGCDSYQKSKNNFPTSNNKWHTYDSQQSSSNAAGDWQQYSQQQQYWGYMTDYGQQQQWQNMDANQQQQWISWWQQQGGVASSDANGIADPGQYWSQYSYSTQTNVGGETSTVASAATASNRTTKKT